MATTFTGPSVDWIQILPIVIVLGAAVIGVLCEAFLPARGRRGFQIVWALLATVASGAAALWLSLSDRTGTAIGHQVMVDKFGLFVQLALAAVALLSVLVIASRSRDKEDAFAPMPAAAPGSELEELARKARLPHSEIFPLTLFALGGMMIFPVAGDFITMFVSLEILSLPLYIMTAMARRRRLLSQEAALKYFLLGAFSSAFFLFGAAWVFGATGSLALTSVSTAIGSGTSGSDLLLYTGLVLVLVGLGFKVGAVPFHAWMPDVYEGAPTPLTGFMAAATKIAAFGAMLRIVYAVVAFLQWDFRPVLWVLACLTMLVGTAIGLAQHNIKRLLAYSAIAHA
ncbi:MAG: NADH-quinone oxidoreductase subunit N, partial [Bifidobacteriaceae bacterium]|nr:NADH-quinone oxidoreductase subunit N [Bifidobacteriaceae bacterium]